MERLSDTRSRGLSAGALRTWGMLFLAAGVFGRGVLQNRFLGIGSLNGQQLLDVMSDPQVMVVASVAIVLQAMETCATPIFSFLLVEGYLHTSDWKKYLLRVIAVALVAEVLFDLAMTGKVLDLSLQNPAFGMVLGLVLLRIYQYFSEKTVQNRFIKIIVFIAAVLWAGMLRIDHGTPVVVLVSVLWFIRAKQQFLIMVGAAAAMACSVISPFYLLASMSFLPIHFFNGEKGEDNRLIQYGAYPVVLLIILLIRFFAF